MAESQMFDGTGMDQRCAGA